MRLVLDVGNTRIKWAWGHGPAQALVYRGLALRDKLRELWEGQGRPTAIRIASVASASVNEAITQAIADCWPGLNPCYLVSRSSCCGVKLAYAKPERFGIDRLAALVAARGEIGDRPLVVIDAGTAVTVDVLDATGQHLGGVIMPGLHLLKTALLRDTAGIEGACAAEVDISSPESGLLPTQTLAAVVMGVRWMLQGGVRAAVEQAQRIVGKGGQTVLTGGDAPLLVESFDVAPLVRPDLVLDGIRRIAEEC